MAFEKYSDEKLLATKKTIKVLLRTLVIIWLVLLIGFLVFVFFFQKFVGPVTVLPLYLQNNLISKELQNRDLD